MTLGVFIGTIVCAIAAVGAIVGAWCSSTNPGWTISQMMATVLPVHPSFAGPPLLPRSSAFLP